MRESLNANELPGLVTWRPMGIARVGQKAAFPCTGEGRRVACWRTEEVTKALVAAGALPRHAGDRTNEIVVVR